MRLLGRIQGPLEGTLVQTPIIYYGALKSSGLYKFYSRRIIKKNVSSFFEELETATIAARRLREDVQQYCSRVGDHVIESKEGAVCAVV